MDKLKGNVAIITGSATGVGAATALLLAEKGCHVVINYSKSEKEAKETAAACEEKGSEVLLCQADVSKDDDCRRMTEAAMEKWSRIDALVNNAGTTKFCNHHNLDGLTHEDFTRIYGVNVIGPYQMTRAIA
ncbi:MAG: SDR family NAD(P)-dependent oxidoreductase, partial [Deltaproteobacteria bacterium]|nr:SDR family NAD(P)-dependent oxidoreductase [Deltaproteobacteria bacterium]